MRQTIIVDFDGVLHSYTSGWKGEAEIPDPPTLGAKEAMAKIRESYTVVVVSSRCRSPEGVNAILVWLAKYEIIVDEVSQFKPPHIVVIDDRALRFNGDWQEMIDGIPAASVPWNKS